MRIHGPILVKRYFVLLSVCLAVIFYTLFYVQLSVINPARQYFISHALMIENKSVSTRSPISIESKTVYVLSSKLPNSADNISSIASKSLNTSTASISLSTTFLSSSATDILSTSKASTSISASSSTSTSTSTSNSTYTYTSNSNSTSSSTSSSTLTSTSTSTSVMPPWNSSLISTSTATTLSTIYRNISTLTTPQSMTSKKNTTLTTKKVTVTERPPNIECHSSKTSFFANLNYTELDLMEGNYDFDDKLQSGGSWIAENAKINVTIIIPFRKRESHLSMFLINIHKFLQMQNISYTLLVVNQVDDKKFNRGGLFNVGFREASKMNNSNDCYFFHDVDAIPESGNLTYCCSRESVIHYSSAMSTKSWKMPYGGFFGGVVAATAAQFQKANGFANRFWGWGGEDDEFRMRVQASGQKVSRIPITEGRYLMFKHERDKGNEANPERVKKIGETGKIWNQEGLNSTNYTLVALLKKKYFIELQVKF